MAGIWVKLTHAIGAVLAVAICMLVVPAGASALPPANDDFADAATLVDDDEVSRSNFGASKEPGEPNHAGNPGGASVWFSWTAPRSENALITFCTSDGWTGLLAVYRGDSLSALEPIASTSPRPGMGCGEAREVRFRVTATTTYRIAVDGYSDGVSAAEQGEFWFRVSGYSNQILENDSFAAATVLESKSPVFFGGSTEGATREPGEPGHGGDLAGASVWYRWTAPLSAAMQLFPCRAGFHPLVSLYTGSELASLSPFGTATPPGNSIFLCQLGGQNGIAFDAVAGTTYFISVDGANGAWGSFQLTLQQAPVPFVDTLAPSTFIRKRIRVRGRQATLEFFANERESTFLCKRDKQPYAPCASPKAYKGLSSGRHRFAVKAVDPGGNVDATPAVRQFNIPIPRERR